MSLCRAPRLAILLALLPGVLVSAGIAACSSPTAARSDAPVRESPPAAATARPHAAATLPALTPQVRTVLDNIKRADTSQFAVSEADGRFLRLLAVSSGARRALEIGAASGYSAIWIGLGLRETGGTLTTIEYDPQRAREAAANVRAAGLSDVVRVVPGDAFQEIPKVAGTFDFVFCDAWKKDYIRFFELVYPRLDSGGLFLGHNVVNKRSELGDFLARIENDPKLLTSIVMPSGEGISITYKRAE